MQGTAEAVGLRLKNLDKKAEKAQTQSLREDLKTQLADQTDPAAALSLVVPLLVIQVTTPCDITASLIASFNTSSHMDGSPMVSYIQHH